MSSEKDEYSDKEDPAQVVKTLPLRIDGLNQELDLKSAALQTECGKRQQKKRAYSGASAREIPMNLPAVHLNWAVKRAY